MSTESILAFAAVAALFIATPGPAVLLALRNGITWGMGAAVWSSLGNITGVFCLSGAAMLGLSWLLQSSEALFGSIKALGAVYFLWSGWRWAFPGPAPTRLDGADPPRMASRRPQILYVEALLVAVLNPALMLFFTALFPQFISKGQPLIPQFYLLTSIYMALSFSTLLAYALMASRARHILAKPQGAVWVRRVVGVAYMAFGWVLLGLEKPLVY